MPLPVFINRIQVQIPESDSPAYVAECLMNLFPELFVIIKVIKFFL